MLEPTTLEVCVDCLMLLANGEVSDGEGNDTEQHAAKMDAVWGDTEITLGRVTPPRYENDDDDPWFSWRQCDGCHSPLGGDRVYATAWTEGGQS